MEIFGSLFVILLLRNVFRIIYSYYIKLPLHQLKRMKNITGFDDSKLSIVKSYDLNVKKT